MEGTQDKSKHILCHFQWSWTMWMNHESQDSPMSHGHNVNHNHSTLCNRGVYSLQLNPHDDDDSTLNPNGNNSISGDSYGLNLYSCLVCGIEGHLQWYCSKTIGRGKYEPDSHTLYPHMTHVTSHDVPNLYYRWLFPQLGDVGLQRESLKIVKVNGLVETEQVQGNQIILT